MSRDREAQTQRTNKNADVLFLYVLYVSDVKVLVRYVGLVKRERERRREGEREGERGEREREREGKHEGDQSQVLRSWS